MDLEARTFCTRTGVQTPILALRWRATRQELAVQRLDLTAHKRGFDRQMYLSVWPITNGQRAQPAPLARFPEEFPVETLTATVTMLDAGQPDGTVVMRLGGMEPGMQYTIRVLTLGDDGWVRGGEAIADFPICVGDGSDGR